MIKLWARSLIAISLVLLVSVMPLLLMHFFGYEPREEWNNGAIETNCYIVSHKINQYQCSYRCNCRTIRINKNSFKQKCDTCYRTCYDGSVLFKHTVISTIYERWDFVYTRQSNGENLRLSLEKKYPINGTIVCYYHPDEPAKFRTEMHNANGFLAGTIVFGVVGIIILIVWGVIEFFINKDKLPCFKSN